jgi:hypothetical protein
MYVRRALLHLMGRFVSKKSLAVRATANVSQRRIDDDPTGQSSALHLSSPAATMQSKTYVQRPAD